MKYLYIVVVLIQLLLLTCKSQSMNPAESGELLRIKIQEHLQNVLTSNQTDQHSNTVNNSFQQKTTTAKSTSSGENAHPLVKQRRSLNDKKCSEGGDSSIGNFGFNSFNFLTFMILTFNAVANINNNINNNNNNNNDISLNSVSQTSSNTVSNSDNSNDIMVMILPVPGKRRRKRRSVHAVQDNNFYIHDSRSEGHFGETGEVMFNSLKSYVDEVSVKEQMNEHCEGYVICKNLKEVMKKLFLDEILLVEFSMITSLFPPLLSAVACESVFPECSARL